MKIPNKIYDFFKWFLLIVVPALTTLISGLGTVYDFNTTQITAVIGLFATFLGTCLGISKISYRRGIHENSENN